MYLNSLSSYLYPSPLLKVILKNLRCGERDKSMSFSYLPAAYTITAVRGAQCKDLRGSVASCVGGKKSVQCSGNGRNQSVLSCLLVQ